MVSYFYITYKSQFMCWNGLIKLKTYILSGLQIKELQFYMENNQGKI